MSLELGMKIELYEGVAEIGAGGMGVAYFARDTTPDQG